MITMKEINSKSGFFSKYIFSMDHKIIARQFPDYGNYLGGDRRLMSLVFRLQLGFPEENYAWLKPILGNGLLLVKEDRKYYTGVYYAMVTMHGTINVFLY
jgi:cytochrome c oxidase subunit 1